MRRLVIPGIRIHLLQTRMGGFIVGWKFPFCIDNKFAQRCVNVNVRFEVNQYLVCQQIAEDISTYKFLLDYPAPNFADSCQSIIVFYPYLLIMLFVSKLVASLDSSVGNNLSLQGPAIVLLRLIISTWFVDVYQN